MSVSACSSRWLPLAVILAAAPVPLGGNRPLAWAALAVALGMALLLAGRGPLPRRAWALAAGWLVVVGWALLQAAPWTPASWHHPLWAEVGGGGAVAVDPAQAVDGALRLLAYLAAFLLAVGAAARVEDAHRLLRVLAGAAASIAAYGLVEHLGGFGRVLWWEKWTYHDSLTATFVNRNAAATLFGFGLLCATALLLERVPQGRLRWLPWAAVALCGAALLLTRSRAGVGAAVLGLVVLTVAVALARRPPARRLWAGIAAGAGVAVVLAVAAGSGVAGRLAASDLSTGDRAPVHAAAAAAIAERPWTGHGLGGFNRAFAAYRPPDLDQHWDKAHSSYLENAFELGVPVAAVMIGTLAMAAAVCGRGVAVRRRHRVYPALGLAALAQAAAHATVDFTLQMPANALWLAALAGIGVAQSIPTRAATVSSAGPDSARR
ncbi:O-antigen ligase family protein [Novispirillum sp. DQ9]|uniref:O-antigen ligase family protein n=1 Tax=Novispirillum sp. DQ9 TaxID=3398612 RepID=UPI003C7D89FD